MPLKSMLLVASGGAVGALLRYVTTNCITYWMGRDFPYGTISINIAGSFLIGLFTTILCQNAMEPQLKLLLITGLLGGFTTFSTFSLDTVNLIASGYWLKTFFYVAGSLILSLTATFAGIAIGSAIKAN